jgi:hypothetical protein
MVMLALLHGLPSSRTMLATGTIHPQFFPPLVYDLFHSWVLQGFDPLGSWFWVSDYFV